MPVQLLIELSAMASLFHASERMLLIGESTCGEGNEQVE